MCSSVQADEVCSNWYQYYQPINHQEANSFLEKGISFAREFFGPPQIKVNHIFLRLSYPLQKNARIRSGFQLFEITDSKKGIYTIYLSRKPNDYAFWGQLAHEIAHCINPKLHDAYVEGLNTLFAEKMLIREGLDWNGWHTYFKNGGEPLYGSTYFLMKDIDRIAGEDNIAKLMTFVEPSDESEKHMHVNIRQWLNSLPPDLRNQVSHVIKSHAPKVRSHIKNMDLAFMLPE
jgi:hypothetical protein